MDIVYKDTKVINPQQLSDLFRKAGIKRPCEDLERLERMLKHADVCITAWEGDTLAGIARAVTDFSYCCYLSDLAVDKQYQGLGIGKRLIKLVQQAAGEETNLVLLSAPTAISFYKQAGLPQTDRAFVINRKK